MSALSVGSRLSSGALHSGNIAASVPMQPRHARKQACLGLRHRIRIAPLNQIV